MQRMTLILPELEFATDCRLICSLRCRYSDHGRQETPRGEAGVSGGRTSHSSWTFVVPHDCPHAALNRLLRSAASQASSAFDVDFFSRSIVLLAVLKMQPNGYLH